MKLLFDQNISRKILPLISKKFPDSSQVYLLGLHEAFDAEIWDYAKKHGYSIVTKDADFHELVLLYGIPPKIIWLRCGNETNQFIVQLLLNKSKEIEEFLLDKDSFCLEIY
jgi:predicted nuclease of predicted toxin-antitoxin system